MAESRVQMIGMRRDAGRGKIHIVSRNPELNPGIARQRRLYGHAQAVFGPLDPGGLDAGGFF